MRRLPRTAVLVAAVVLATAGAAGTASAFYALTSTPAATTHAVAALTAPQAFTVTTGLVGQEGVAELTWTPPASPAVATGLRYTVLRGDVPACSGTADAVCVDSQLLPGSTHTWTVQALLGAWRGPTSTVSATLPVARALTVSAPPDAVAGTPFDVVLTATDRGAPDTTALGVRTLTVTGPSEVGGNVPTTSVTAAFVLQPDGSVTATAAVTLAAAETTALTVSEPAVPGRSGTSGQVVVAPQAGASAFADCQGPPDYSCGSRTPLAGTTVSGVVQRDAVDPLGNALPLPAETVTLTIKNDRKGVLTATVEFAAGETSSSRWSFTPGPGANGNVAVTAGAPTGRTAPAPLALRL